MDIVLHIIVGLALFIGIIVMPFLFLIDKINSIIEDTNQALKKERRRLEDLRERLASLRQEIEEGKNK